MKWSNTGVGKLYQPYVLRFFLLDSKGETILTSDALCDPGKWLPGEQNVTEQILVPTLVKKGNYKLAIAMVDKSGIRRPFRLAVNIPEKDGKYILSEINIR